MQRLLEKGGLGMVETGRRVGPRRPLSTDVCLLDETGEPVVLEATDLGPGGVFVQSELLLEPGEEMWVSLHVPGGPKIVARGRVVRGQVEEETGPPGMAIAFVDLTDREAGYLTDYANQGALDEACWPVVDGRSIGSVNDVEGGILL